MRIIRILLFTLLILLLSACTAREPAANIAATTGPVAQFASAIAEGSGVTVTQVISDSVSCLHDYTLSVGQMEALEQSTAVLISGVELEEFMEDALRTADRVYDCSHGVELLPMEGHHDHDEHDHHGHGHYDPHIWLDPENAMVMAQNICDALTELYPAHQTLFAANTQTLLQRLQALDAHGRETLSGLSCQNLITFHDGFGYLAHAYDLEILEAIEEESGSEASARELIHMVELVQEHDLPAVFTEVNGSVSAASIIAAETGVQVCTLDMAMGGSDYFEAMEHNFQTLAQALHEG